MLIPNVGSEYEALPCSIARKEGAVGLMVEGWMVIGAVVTPFEAARGPVEPKLALFLPTAQPVEAELRGLELVGDNGIVDDARSG